MLRLSTGGLKYLKKDQLHLIILLFSIDATDKSHMACFINDSQKHANSLIKRVEDGNKIRVFIEAKNKILAGSELRYDYAPFNV